MALFTTAPKISANSFTTLSSTYDNEYDISPYSPLKRRLRFNDLQAVILPNGAKAYCLRQSAGVSLWWTLDSIRDDINSAGLAPIRNDPTYPAAARSYIPDALFTQIGMERPEVLKAVEIDSFNPLYLLTSIPNIVAFWTQLQHIGLAGLAWIREAKERSRLIGPQSGWNWDFQQTQEIDIPKYTIIPKPQISDANALGLYFDYSVSAARANTPTSIYSDAGSLIGTSAIYSPTDAPDLLSNSRELVLHPFFSNYAFANPNYDVFSHTELIDNGYIAPGSCAFDTEMDTSDDGVSDTSSGSDLSYLSTCNSINSLPTHSDFDLHTPLPIVIDNEDLGNVGESFNLTATNMAEYMFPAIRPDIVNA